MIHIYSNTEEDVVLIVHAYFLAKPEEKLAE